MKALRFLGLAAAFVCFVAFAPAMADGDRQRGAKVFKKCVPCHSAEAAGRAKLGPNLHGLFGRTSGGAKGYKYSEAMKAAGVRWDEETLNAYLSSPKDFIPGNREPFAGLKDAQDRADVIAYLKEATQ